MASISKQTTVTANAILIKVDGNVVGRAQSLSPRTDFGTQGVYEIGSIMPAEHVQLKYDGSFTLDRYLLMHDDLEQAGYIGLGEDILKKDIIDIEIQNKVTGKTLRVYRGCTFSNYSININANAIVGETATVYYLSCDKGE